MIRYLLLLIAALSLTAPVAAMAPKSFKVTQVEKDALYADYQVVQTAGQAEPQIAGDFKPLLNEYNFAVSAPTREIYDEHRAKFYDEKAKLCALYKGC